MGDRVLVISQRFWPENNKINDICKAMENSGLHVDVLCGQPNYPTGQFYAGYHTRGHRDEKLEHIQIFRSAEIKRDHGNPLRIILNYISFAVSAHGKIAGLAKNKYDAVLYYQDYSLLACSSAVSISKALKIPLTIFASSVWPESFYREMDMQNGLLRKIFRSIAEKNYLSAAHVVTTSEKAADYLRSELHVLPYRTEILVPGPDSSIINGKCSTFVREKYAGSFNIVCFAESRQTIDIKTLTETARLIAGAGIHDIKIIIVCPKGTLKSFTGAISKAKLGDIIFIEETDAPSEYYEIAGIGLSCKDLDSKDEYRIDEDIINFMGKGKPVIVANGSLEKKIVRTAKCGLTSEPKDAEGLYRAIISLYRGKDFAEMGQNALEYQMAHFNREDNVDRLIKIMFSEEPESPDGFVINQNIKLIRTDDI